MADKATLREQLLSTSPTAAGSMDANGYQMWAVCFLETVLVSASCRNTWKEQKQRLPRPGYQAASNQPPLQWERQSMEVFRLMSSIWECDTPLKGTQLHSIWKGTPVNGRKYFTHEIAHPQRLYSLNEKLHIPKDAHAYHTNMFSSNGL